MVFREVIMYVSSRFQSIGALQSKILLLLFDRAIVGVNSDEIEGRWDDDCWKNDGSWNLEFGEVNSLGPRVEGPDSSHA